MNNKRNLYCSDTRYEKVWEQMQLLDIQDVSTERQIKNGTIVWKLPVKCQYGGAIHVASFASGYVRRIKAGGYCPSWQLNKRCEGEPEYFKLSNGDYRKFTTRACVLIPNEQDRLEYLISFCLKNYYIGYANKLSSGEFVPKWKYDDAIKLGEEYAREPDVKVIVNGHRYNLS
jgi:hypothetical protein